MASSTGNDEKSVRSKNTLKIPGYKFGRLIAKGGMAAVYLAKQKSLDRLVAIKILRNTENLSFSQRFLNEGRIIAALNHRNIITIYDIGALVNYHYISMEYVEGGDLEAKIISGITDYEALELLRVIGGCLDFVHQNGIIHRDIKPANILFRTDGTPLLTDFGIAKEVQTDNELTQHGLALGSPYYFSPEQAQGKPIDGRTDLYGLGVIFYEILTGQKPFVGDTPIDTIVAHLQEPIPKLPARFKAYQNLLDRMLAKDADERFGSAAQMVEAIEKIQAAVQKKSSLRALITRLPMVKKNKWLKERRFKPIIYGLAMLIFAAIAGHYFLSASFNLSDSSLVTSSQHQSDSRINRSSTGRSFDDTVDGPQQTERLLALASRSFNDGRLVLPENDSASYYYSRILKTDSGNENARKGLNAVVNRLAEKTQRFIHERNYAAAQQYLDYGVSLQPEYIQWSELKAQLAPFRKKISRLNQLATLRFEKDQLTLPKNDNALFYYREILKLNPGDESAAKGITKLADRYADLGMKATKQSDYRNAGKFLERGLDIQANNKNLQALSVNVAKVQKKIAKFLSIASKRYQQNKLTRPRGNSAAFYFQQILRIDRYNAAAVRGITNIGNRYAAMAKTATKEFDFDKASKHLQRGLEIQSGNLKLLALSSKLTQTKKKIKQSLAKGSQRYKQDKLTLPKHDSAVYYYSKVLKLDGKNTQATKGINKIVKRYRRLATDAVAQSEYSEARNYLKRGLAIQPTNKSLRALMKKLAKLDTPQHRFMSRVKNLFN